MIRICEEGYPPATPMPVPEFWKIECGVIKWACGKERAIMSSIAGELVTETFGYDGGRQVTVYRPAGRPEAVVFAGDGQLISQWGADLEAADVPPTMVVGVHRLADEMLRLHEYSRDSIRTGSRHTKSSLSMMSADGWGRASASRRRANGRLYSASRPVASSRWRSGWDTRTSTVRSSPRHPAAVTDRLP